MWFDVQDGLNDIVEDYISATADPSTLSLNPRVGQGLTRDTLVKIPQLEDVEEEHDILRDVFTEVENSWDV